MEERDVDDIFDLFEPSVLAGPDCRPHEARDDSMVEGGIGLSRGQRDRHHSKLTQKTIVKVPCPYLHAPKIREAAGPMVEIQIEGRELRPTEIAQVDPSVCI